MTLTGNMSAARSSINADIQAPSFTYGGHDFEGTRLQLVTAADTLKADLTLARLNEEDVPVISGSWQLRAMMNSLQLSN